MPFHEVVGNYLHRFLPLSSASFLLKQDLSSLSSETTNSEFSKMIYDCVYYHEEALIEEQNNLYRQVKEKIQQYKENVEENQWAEEHKIFIDEESTENMTEPVKFYEGLLSQLDELNEQYETKLPPIGDKSTLINVLDDIRMILVSAETYKSVLLNVLSRAARVQGISDLSQLVEKAEKRVNEAIDAHHAHAHLKYNSNNQSAGLLREKEQLLNYARESTLNTMGLFEAWQRTAFSETTDVSPTTQDTSSKHSPLIDHYQYNQVLLQYRTLYTNIYKYVMDPLRSVSLVVVTVSNEEQSKIVYIAPTQDVKINFSQFVNGAECEPLLEVGVRLHHPKYAHLTKKVHFFTLDQDHHIPLELSENASGLIQGVSQQLIKKFAPEMNLRETTNTTEVPVDSLPLDKIHNHYSI